jgi:hypothetical protein
VHNIWRDQDIDSCVHHTSTIDYTATDGRDSRPTNYSVYDGLTSRLQPVENAVARLVTCLGRREHITPVLRQPHWLSDCQYVNVFSQVGDAGSLFAGSNSTRLPVGE